MRKKIRPKKSLTWFFHAALQLYSILSEHDNSPLLELSTPVTQALNF